MSEIKNIDIFGLPNESRNDMNEIPLYFSADEVNLILEELDKLAMTKYPYCERAKNIRKIFNLKLSFIDKAKGIKF